MKRLTVLLSVLCFSFSVNAALTLKEVRTASNNVIAVYFMSTTVNVSEVSTTASQWTVNGQAVSAINKYVMQSNGTGCEHHIYLTVPTLVNGTTYAIHTPIKDTSIVFDDHKIFCEID